MPEENIFLRSNPISLSRNNVPIHTPSMVNITEPIATPANDLKTNTAIRSPTTLVIVMYNTFKKFRSGLFTLSSPIPVIRSMGNKQTVNRKYSYDHNRTISRCRIDSQVLMPSKDHHKVIGKNKSDEADNCKQISHGTRIRIEKISDLLNFAKKDFPVTSSEKQLPQNSAMGFVAVPAISLEYCISATAAVPIGLRLIINVSALRKRFVPIKVKVVYFPKSSNTLLVFLVALTTYFNPSHPLEHTNNWML